MYSEYLAWKQREYGDKFDPSDLAQQFVRYFESGERIRVERHGNAITGHVGVTGGWKPAFLLIRKSNAIGSADVLSDSHRITHVQRGRKYVAV